MADKSHSATTKGEKRPSTSITNPSKTEAELKKEELEKQSRSISKDANFDELTANFEYEGEIFRMDKKRVASFNIKYHPLNTKNKNVKKQSCDGQDAKLGKTSLLTTIGRKIFYKPETNDCLTTDIPVEHRGITFRQLLAVKANIDRRCREEEWTNREGELLTPNTVTLYDVKKYIIMPFTVNRKKDFVSSLPSTAGPQIPRWFVSHCWAEKVTDFIACVEQFIDDFSSNIGREHHERGGGMSIDTPIWICAYALNQWNLQHEITENPFQSGFTQAMKAANYRTLSIIDRDAKVFNRMWCIMELFLTLSHSANKNSNKQMTGEWAVYTAQRHTLTYGYTTSHRKAVGIVTNGTTMDDILAASYGRYRPTYREKHFPLELIIKSLGLKVEEADVSEPTDRVHILNAIISADESCINLNDAPPSQHNQYNKLNDAVRAAFASSPGLLQRILLDENDRYREQFLRNFSNGGTMRRKVHFTFDNEWENVRADRAAEFISYLPINLESFSSNYEYKWGDQFAVALAAWIKRASHLKYFSATGKYEDDGINALLDAINESKNMQYLALYVGMTDDHVFKLGNIIMKNLSITTVYVGVGYDPGDDVAIKKVIKQTKKRTPSVSIAYN